MFHESLHGQIRIDVDDHDAAESPVARLDEQWDVEQDRGVGVGECLPTPGHLVAHGRMHDGVEGEEFVRIPEHPVGHCLPVQ